jgi:hypothetical protein
MGGQKEGGIGRRGIMEGRIYLLGENPGGRMIINRKEASSSSSEWMEKKKFILYM